MQEPWLDPEIFSWLPGTILGVVGAVYGAAMGALVSVKSMRAVMYLVDGILVVASFCMLLFGVTGFFMGQPYTLWGGFVLPGIIGVVAFSLLWVGLKALYKQVDEQEARERAHLERIKGKLR